MPDRIAPSPLDVPMYSDSELREACRKATERERQRIRSFVVVLRHSAMSKHPVACAALLAAADQLAGLLDGDDDAR